MITLGSLNYDGQALVVQCGTYDNGRIAFLLVCGPRPVVSQRGEPIGHLHVGGSVLSLDQSYPMEGEAWAKLSINVIGEPIGWGEFVANHDLTDVHWRLIRQLLTGYPANGPAGMGESVSVEGFVPMFEDTGRRCSFGFVHGSPILRLSAERLAFLEGEIAALQASVEV